MDNHYHLLVRTPQANLSAALQWLNVAYSIWWNRRHERVGHVFQGRFKAVVVESGEWVLACSLYLHLNPVAVGALGMSKDQKKAEARGQARAPELVRVQRLERLRGYRWSSFRAYAGYDAPAAWLSTGEVLRRRRCAPLPADGAREGRAGLGGIALVATQVGVGAWRAELCAEGASAAPNRPGARWPGRVAEPLDLGRRGAGGGTSAAAAVGAVCPTARRPRTGDGPLRGTSAHRLDASGLGASGRGNGLHGSRECHQTLRAAASDRPDPPQNH
ncbi:hypothetical protein SBV1_1800007 [Verrucomicrobia bacterium]|nr:hypothetical protein SBV1_1800007 [Verrucomicrobiota bacterium]